MKSDWSERNGGLSGKGGISMGEMEKVSKHAQVGWNWGEVDSETVKGEWGWSDPADWINTLLKGTEIETTRATGSLEALLGTPHCTQLIGV